MHSLDPSIMLNSLPSSHSKQGAAKDSQQGADSFAAVLQQTQHSTATPVSAVEDTQETDKNERSVVDEFMQWMQMTPAEKLRDRILKELGLTEEDIKQMDPEQRNKIEALIAQKIRTEQELKNQPKRDQS